jgi:hypothetical protein
LDDASATSTRRSDAASVATASFSELASRSALFLSARFRASCFRVVALGSFHTSERRGGVERRQVELKGVEGGY